MTGRAGEQSSSEQVTELTMLFQLTDALQRAGSMGDIYHAALEAILIALRCNRASILLFDKAGVMRFVAWRGLSDSYRQAVDGHSPWKVGERNPDPIFVSDIDDADEPEALKTTIRAEGIRALGFVPLISNGAVIGKFMTYHKTPRVFSKDDRDLALTIARQLGFTIERYRSEEARRTAEERLLRGQARLRQILDSAKEYAIITLDDHGAIASWNNGAERLLGYEESEALGRSGDIFFSPEDIVADVPDLEMKAAREQGRATNERWHMRKNGSRFWGSGVMLPIDDGGQDRYLKIFRDRTEERQAEQRQKLLIGELNHRVKNTLATVQSLAEQTLRSSETPGAFATAFRSRIHALADAHDLLTREAWEGVDMKDIAHAVLYTWIEDGRAFISGPSIRIGPKQALALSMALNELLTNATKHGALSVPNGYVEVSWKCERHCQIEWVENGGPPVSPPKREGFGLRVLNRALAADLGRPVKLVFGPAGVTCSIHVEIAEARANPEFEI